MTYAEEVPNRLAGLIWREVDDGTVIVSPTAGKIRVLNQIGSTIWELVDGNRSVTAIEIELVETFADVPRERIAQDLQAFLTDLTERGLVTWS